MWKYRRKMPIILKFKLNSIVNIEIVYNRIEIEKIYNFTVYLYDRVILDNF